MTWDSRIYGFAQATIIETTRTLYISGQNGISKDGKIVGKDFESQCTQSFENMSTILAKARTNFSNVVKVTAYFTNISSAPAYSTIASSYFKDHLPTQTLLEVRALALPDLVFEIEAIAAL